MTARVETNAVAVGRMNLRRELFEGQGSAVFDVPELVAFRVHEEGVVVVVPAPECNARSFHRVAKLLDAPFRVRFMWHFSTTSLTQIRTVYVCS
jgi:hypothetical protein